MEKKKRRSRPRAIGCRRLFLAAGIVLSLLCSLPIVLTLPELQWHIDHNVRPPIIAPAPASKESDLIAFICGGIYKNPRSAVYVIHSDGSQLRQIHARPRMSFANLSWSPDGYWMAVLAERDFFVLPSNEKFEIFRIRFDGLDYKRLTYNRFREIAPRWSKDGKSISFVHRGNLHRISDNGQEISRSYRSRIVARPWDRRPFDWSADDQRIIATGNYDALVYGSDPDGSDWRVLTRTGTYLSDVAWAPNDEQIMYFGHGLGLEYSELAVFNVKEQVEEFSLKMEFIYDAQWSPNGKWIAIKGEKLDEGEGIHIFLLDVDTAVVDYVKRLDTGKLGDISWSPDSEWIAFSVYDYLFEDEYISRMFKIKRDGRDLQRLTDMDCTIEEISWSPK
ncbi:MAG: hypothetical protein OXG60_06750 [Chloroflexi bacterium]|nr:hypothetical protein [Chloroflexota bacterium]